MFDLDAFMARGYDKVMGHYRWMRDTSLSDSERARFQHRMNETEAERDRSLTRRIAPMPLAA